MRFLHRVFAFLLLPFIGYLLGATIFLHFYDQAGAGDLGKARFIAVATSCQSDGPVSMLGFGYRWRCRADVTHTESGDVTRTVTKGFLKPEDIGRQVAVVGVRRSPDFAPAERPYQALGVLLNIPFLALWVYVIARAANPLMRNRIDKILADARAAASEEAPVTEVRVAGGRKGWLPGKVGFPLAALCAFFADRAQRTAFDPTRTGLPFFVMGIVGIAGLWGLIGYGIWRMKTVPTVTIGVTGLAMGKALPWERIDHVELVDGRLVVHPRGGPPLTSRPFGDTEVEEIDEAVRRFSPVPYARA